MKSRKVILQKEAVEDLENGRVFYDHLEPGVGDYFFDALLADLDALSFYAGIHPVHFEFHRSLSKRFPFAIYYEVKEDLVVVIAVLDMRRNPAWRHAELGTRYSDSDVNEG